LGRAIACPVTVDLTLTIGQTIGQHDGIHRPGGGAGNRLNFNPPIA
jgi:hypothetical protein